MFFTEFPMKMLLIATSLALATASSFALPSVEDVQAEVAKGNYSQAEVMMREVVAARPGSARAHYVYAEILAHDRRFDQAAAELARARQIDPADGYTSRARLDAFSALLEREQAAASRSRALAASPGRAAAPTAAPMSNQSGPSSDGVPGWVWGAGGGLLALAAWRLVDSRSRTRAAQSAGGAYGPSSAYTGGPAGSPLIANGMTGGGPGYVPGYPQPSGGLAGGMLGTGLAVAGGVAAGLLAERLFEGHRDSAGTGGGVSMPGTGLGGGALSAGLGAGLLDSDTDETAARELQDRPIDFGSGNGWGGEAGDASGGSSDDGGW
jgi:tetratricopeptide (TPR) repeat protein